MTESLTSRVSKATQQIESAGEVFSEVKCADSNTMVDTGCGAVPSLRKVLKDLGGYQYKGVWTANTEYEAKDQVKDSDGAIWLCIENHTSGAEFDVDAQAGKWIAFQVIRDTPVFNRRVIDFGVGVAFGPYEEDGRTLLPRLRIGAVEYVAVCEITESFTFTSDNIEDSYDGEVVIQTSEGEKVFSRSESEAVTRNDVESINYSLVPVVSTGTLTPRTLEERFSERVSVKDFGAIGDGINNDTSAFKLAFESHASEIRVPKGQYIVTESLELPQGKSLIGDGIDYWDTWRPNEEVLKKSMSEGSHILFKTTGAKKYTAINLSHNIPQIENDSLLLDFTNNDSSAGRPATPKPFSAGIVVKSNSCIKNLRIVPWFNGIDGYNDYSTRKLADDWDVGIWLQGANESVLENIQCVGYWRKAGCLFSENDGSYSQIGMNPERVRITNCAFTGVRGIAIRNSPQWRVLENTYDTVTCEWNPSWTLTSQNSFKIHGSSSVFTFTNYSFSNNLVTLAGVYPPLPNSVIAVRSPSAGNNLSGSVLENSYCASLEHSSKTPSENLGLPKSGAMEINGYPLRGMKFINSKFQTTFDKINTIFGDCRDMKFVACQFENGLLYAFDNTQASVSCTENLRMTNTYISSSTNRNNFTPRGYFNDYDQFPTQFSDGAFVLKNWSFGNIRLEHYDGTILQLYRPSDNMFRQYCFDGKQHYQFNGKSDEVTIHAKAFSIKRREDNKNFLMFYSSGNAETLASFTSGGDLVSNGKTRPKNDNNVSVGDAGHRYSQLYAANGAINTSDRNSKTEIECLSEAEKSVARKLKLLICKYKIKEAVEIKGKKARTHIGVIAQNVEEAFISEGLNGFDYGVLCYDEWDDEIDENGKIINESGFRYGIRYDELFAFIIAGM